MFVSSDRCARAQPTQGKPEGWKMMMNLRTNIDHFDFLGLVPPQKMTTATTKEGPSLLVKVQAKLYYSLKTMARKFRKYGQVQNTCKIRQHTKLSMERKRIESKH